MGAVRNLTIAVLATVLAGAADAADIRVLSVGAVQGAVRGLAADFAKESGHQVVLTVAAPVVAMQKIKDGEVWLLGSHISHYSHGNINNHDVLRPRKMLLHRKEIEKLEKETTQKGMTLVVTRIYWKNGRIKFEVGVAKGKKLFDKRETEMRKTIDKETRQELKEKLR